ncbi:hypothetical protein [Streptomyces roseoverticillatus]|uniref:Uncharacterized protein n=1 Tax=Streptomyces roseoverticillatus TaxID=66429 RepID=A0ABV3IN34_9ACTN
MAGTWPEALESACPEHSGEEAARAPRRLARRPDPAARRAVIPLVAGAAALADLCRTEAQPSVRVPLLPALGDAAAAAERAASASTEHEGYERYEAAQPGYQAVLQDEELRAAVEDVLTLRIGS